MLENHDKLERGALGWLHNFSQELECDPEVLKHLSDKDLRKELQNVGADVEGFHSRLNNTLHAAKLKRAGESFIQWISPLWQPQWSGQFVGAGDIPKQIHNFSLEHGKVEISCAWNPQQGSTPAYLDLSWNADTLLEGVLYCRFVQPDTQAVLAEISLGRSQEGGKYLTPHELGFDPSLEAWALVILVKQSGE